jgi:hypothetical protein
MEGAVNENQGWVFGGHDDRLGRWRQQRVGRRWFQGNKMPGEILDRRYVMQYAARLRTYVCKARLLAFGKT